MASTSTNGIANNPQLSGNARFTELGATGLVRWGGNVSEEFLVQLQGKNAIKTYQEMASNDPVVGAILFAIEMLIRQVEWKAEPASDSTADVEAADFLGSCMYDMSATWQDNLSEVLSMLTFGWSYHEVVYKLRQGINADPKKNSRHNDGRIGWRKWPIRSQSSLYEWMFDDEGGLQGMRQMSSPTYQVVDIPIEKALLFTTRQRKGNPEGVSLLRNAYRPWYFKKRIEEIEGIGIERDLAGLPTAFVPPKMLSSEASPVEVDILNKIKAMVVNVRRDQQEGVVFPLAYDENGKLMYDFKLMSTGGSRQFDTDKIIARYDQRIAMTVLADFILLGHEQVGSFALSSSKTGMFATALGAILDAVAAVINRHAVPKLFSLNDFSVEALPQINHGDIETPDLAELGDFITKLAGAGMPVFPDDDVEQYLRKVGGLPAKATNK